MTVSPRSVSTIGRRGAIGGVDVGVVAALGRLDLEPERPQGGHVRLDGAGAEVAAAGVRELELVAVVQQRAEEHDDAAGTASGLLVDGADRSRRSGAISSRSLSALSQRYRTPMLASTSRMRLTSSIRATLRSVVRPLLSSDAHSSATPAFLLDFTSIEPDEHRAADDPQVHRAGHAERDDLGVERLADPGEHLQAEVLLAALDPVDRALAGAEHVGQLGLGVAAVLASVADELADPAEVVLSHQFTVSHI